LLALLLVVACSPAAAPPAAPSPPPTTTPPTPVGGTATTAQAPPKPGADDAKVEALAKDYLAYIVSSSPEKATQLGLHARDAELDDPSPAHLEANAKARASLLESARALKNGDLSRAAATDVELVTSALEVEDRTFSEVRPHERNPALYAEPMDAIFFMTARDYAPS
jgi:uncharacterized protein (DUF885 family)